ncbi:MAG TPA: SDR family oxidoreductase [Candidatus Binataceae bacterium]|jgi:short-subunit dehydrogenase|nr:SDR family oxidoreductase [Candidatus Binataceae bacterium]
MPTALITGASSGLGEQFAYALARQSFALVLVARRRERLDAVAARARQIGAPRTDVIELDLAKRESPHALCDQLRTLGLQVDYLVNNAGFGTSGFFHKLDLARELEEIDLNISSLVALTRLLLPAMVERHAGTIINVASTAAFQAIPFMSTYAATKAFVLSFTEGLAGELVGTGLRVMALCPGPVKTEFQTVAKNEKSLMPEFVYVPAEKVVAGAISAAASGRTVYIAGGLNFLGAQMTRLAPRSLINLVSRRIYRPNAD